MVYNSLWSANEKRRGQMIHPKEVLAAPYDGREKKTTNTKGDFVGIARNRFCFSHSFAPPLMLPKPLVTDTIGLMMGGAVDSDCVID